MYISAVVKGMLPYVWKRSLRRKRSGRLTIPTTHASLIGHGVAKTYKVVKIFL